MLAIHLSDLHLSRYGETGTWIERDGEDERWELVHRWQRWAIEGLRDRRQRPDKLRLVDPSGVIHKRRSWPAKGDDKVVGALLSLAMERHLTSAERLVDSRPTSEDLGAMLRVDPVNTNLLFLRLLDEILPLGPELILLTGDVTDNGLGYGLVEHYLRPWIERGRLLVVAGNHDIYDMFPRKGRKARRSAKEASYRTFSEHVGIVCHESDAWSHRIEDVVFVGLNSCKAPVTLLNASGVVSKEQLVWLGEQAESPDFRDARLRVALVHHHLLRMPFELGKRNPIEVGMRLRNAPDVMRACKAAGLDMILNGHRHHGYMVKLPVHPMVISSPSSTLGCKSTDLEYVWLVDLAARQPYPQIHILKHDLGTPPPRQARGRSPRRVT